MLHLQGEGTMVLKNVSNYLSSDMVPHLWRAEFSAPPTWKPQISQEILAKKQNKDKTQNGIHWYVTLLWQWHV